ncbi:MAG: hypothetical protein DPW18_20120 [Chloroflexi bacterium]|nr:hypothetical protein [Chloroflexota bacterium]
MTCAACMMLILNSQGRCNKKYSQAEKIDTTPRRSINMAQSLLEDGFNCYAGTHPADHLKKVFGRVLYFLTPEV